MPEMLSLEVGPREVVGKKVKALRRAGVVPGVVYGHHAETCRVQMDERELGRFLSRLSASSLIQVVVQGEDSPRPALIRDVQRHVLTQRIQHVDFLQVDLTEQVRIDVPIVSVGEAPVALPEAAVTSEDGTTLVASLIQELDSLEVECLPTDIPTGFSVDVSGMASVHDVITVADLQVPEGVTVHNDPEHVVFRILVERFGEEEEDEDEIAEVEVITASEAERRAEEREEEEEED